MRTSSRRHGLVRETLVALMLTTVSIAGAQQRPDSAFAPPPFRPAWGASAGPTLCLDEGHHNFHTLDGRFLVFGRLARRDGFHVRALRAEFSAATLAECRILVISNAQPSDDEWSRYPSPTPSAFSADEIAAVRAWVHAGGALLLIADHMPLAGAARDLAAAFGAQFTDGFAVKRFADQGGRDASFAVPTLFRTTDGTLPPHPVLRGRDSTEAVTQVRSFTGQAFTVTAPGAAPLMVLPSDFVSLEPRVAWRFDADTPARPVGGWLQGATLRAGRGRVALFGEAAMFSAQVTGPDRKPMGMNAPMAEQNARFALNVLHWLAGLLGD